MPRLAKSVIRRSGVVYVRGVKSDFLAQELIFFILLCDRERVNNLIFRSFSGTMSTDFVMIQNFDVCVNSLSTLI